MDTKETIQIVIGKCRLHRLIIASRVRRRTTRELMRRANNTESDHLLQLIAVAPHLLAVGMRVVDVCGVAVVRPRFEAACREMTIKYLLRRFHSLSKPELVFAVIVQARSHISRSTSTPMRNISMASLADSSSGLIAINR